MVEDLPERLISDSASAAMAVMTSAQLLAGDSAAEQAVYEASGTPYDLQRAVSQRSCRGCRMLTVVLGLGPQAASAAAAQGVVRAAAVL